MTQRRAAGRACARQASRRSRAGEASGLLVGGTLTQLAASLGHAVGVRSARGCVLFIEDVGERPYRIDRMLTQLAQAGISHAPRRSCSASCRRATSPAASTPFATCCASSSRDFHGPVLFGFPSGHTTGATWTLPFGVQARSRDVAAPALVIEEAAVT